MTTPWDLISDDAFKNWLLETPMTDIEYNTASLIDRRALKTEFQRQLRRHQAQQQYPDTARAASERSTKILNAWCTEISTLPAPDRQELKLLIETKLPAPIPTLDYSAALIDNPEADVLRPTLDGKTNLATDLERLRSNIIGQRRFGTSEDSVHAIVENLIIVPMYMIASYMGVALRIDRNSVDPSGATLNNLLPDVLVWLPSGVLAFKGEDKATAQDLHIALRELTSKLSVFTDTFFGSIRYQLCYALGGEMLQFCVILRKCGGRSELVTLAEADLSTVRGRSLCVRYVVNLARLLVAMQRAFPGGSVVHLGTTVSSLSSVVSIFGDHVVKKAKLHSGEEVLRNLYELLEQSRGVEGLIRLHKSPKMSINHFTVYVQPVGFCGKIPLGLDEVKVAGKSILSALWFLHSHHWVHRDLRPSNIMFADGNWYLIDLEWANYADSELGAFRPQVAWTPTEITDESSKWTCACDMWQFGRVLEAWGNLDEEGRDYIRIQSKVHPNERLSAEASLHHPFFA